MTVYKGRKEGKWDETTTKDGYLFNTRASDEKGHFERVRLKVPQKLNWKCQAIINLKKYSELKTTHDVYRAFTDRFCDELLKQETSVVSSLTAAIREVISQSRERREHNQTCYLLDSEIEDIIKYSRSIEEVKEERTKIIAGVPSDFRDFVNGCFRKHLKTYSKKHEGWTDSLAEQFMEEDDSAFS